MRRIGIRKIRENGGERLLSDSGIFSGSGKFLCSGCCERRRGNDGLLASGIFRREECGRKTLSRKPMFRDEHSATSGTAIKKRRMDFVNGHLEGYTDIYHVSGIGTEDEPEEFTPFWFRTFRFIEVTIQTREEPLAVRAFDYEETGYPSGKRDKC